MTGAMKRPAMRLRMRGISRIVLLIGALGRRKPRAAPLDIGRTPKERLRDIGILNGRGPSLRRPERNPDRFGRSG